MAACARHRWAHQASSRIETLDEPSTTVRGPGSFVQPRPKKPRGRIEGCTPSSQYFAVDCARLAQQGTTDLSDASLEELSKIQVYSASKHMPNASQSPASITMSQRTISKNFRYRNLARLRELYFLNLTFSRARVHPEKGPKMFSKVSAITHTALAVALSSAALLSQQTPAPQPTCSLGCEFPVVMRQNVAAGKTPVGTKVEAKVIVATLLNGTVIPRDAILSGEVSESAAKSGTGPSRLAIRMDSAQWKSGSTPLKVYLTAWFYPEATGMAAQDLSYQPADAANSKRNWNGMGTYPDPNNPISQQKFPGPASNISKHRVLMKNVESASNTNGEIVLTSSRSNIKLDKLTAYVFAGEDLLPRK